MDLRSNNPFWLLKNGIVANYPSLSQNIKTEVAIIGAGITGALMAWHLCKAGIKVTIIDRRHAGMGSTAASTGLLQYEIDTPLYKLCNYVGEKNAARSYLLCLKAIYDIESVCKKLKTNTGFELKESFQYASFKKDVPGLRKEFELRKKHGIALEWLEQKEIVNKWGFDAPAGLLSKSGAYVDPYKLAHELLQQSIHMGLTIYDNTNIDQIEHTKKNIKLVADNGCIITANKLVMASGYESQKYITKKVENFNSTYAIISEPLSNKECWYKNSLIWETATPYLYMRTTADNRIIVGGKDDEFSDPIKREQQLPYKARALEKAFAKKFPHVPFKTDFKWAGVFASTKDGLPYIGTVPEHPHTYFALGFGGNGITYSIIAAHIIRDAIIGKINKNAALFLFER